jgi:hypothetical protein
MWKPLIIAAAAPLLWAGAAAAFPAAPTSAPSNVIEARTICDAYGRCCATGSGDCFYNVQPRRTYVYPERRRYAPPAYGYREPYRERRNYYGGPSVGVYGGGYRWD